MVASGSLLVFGGRLAAEFSAPDDEGIFEHAAALEVFEQSRDRFVSRTRVEIVIVLEISVRIPVVIIVGPARVDLDKPRPPFDETAGEETFAAEVFGLLTIHAVEGLRLFALLLHRDGLGRGRLHAVGKFVAGDARGEIGVVKTRREMTGVEMIERIDEQALLPCGHPVDMLQIENGISL